MGDLSIHYERTEEMLQEFEQVALVVNVPAYGFVVGDVGTVVDITRNCEGITVEFFNFAGETIAIVPLHQSDVRLLGVSEGRDARSVLPSLSPHLRFAGGGAGDKTRALQGIFISKHKVSFSAYSVRF